MNQNSKLRNVLIENLKIFKSKQKSCKKTLMFKTNIMELQNNIKIR